MPKQEPIPPPPGSGPGPELGSKSTSTGLPSNVAAALACIPLVGGIIFYIVGLLVGGNRVPAKVEIAGLDVPEMGAFGYPEFIKHIPPSDVSDAMVEAIRAGKALEPTDLAAMSATSSGSAVTV